MIEDLRKDGVEAVCDSLIWTSFSSIGGKRIYQF